MHFKLWLGSTRIDSDSLELWKKNTLKLNKIKTFPHLKVKIPVKNRPN